MSDSGALALVICTTIKRKVVQVASHSACEISCKCLALHVAMFSDCHEGAWSNLLYNPWNTAQQFLAWRPLGILQAFYHAEAVP